MPSPPPSESIPKGGESEDPEAKVTRGNFEALAKGLFTVTPAQYAAEEARQRSSKKRPAAPSPMERLESAKRQEAAIESRFAELPVRDTTSEDWRRKPSRSQ